MAGHIAASHAPECGPSPCPLGFRVKKHRLVQIADSLASSTEVVGKSGRTSAKALGTPRMSPDFTRVCAAMAKVLIILPYSFGVEVAVILSDGARLRL